jgi:prepilin-type processing-associated H-X9-DG protein
VSAAAPKVGENVEKGLAAFEAQTKISIRKGLLESLAGPVVHYSLGPGAVPEAPMGGAVVLVKLKDAELFEKTMNSIGEFAAAQSKGAFQATTQKRDDGRVVHSWTVAQLAMMQVMPTWSVTKDYAVIGLNPGVYEAAVKQMAATGAERKSIRDTPGYKEVTAQLPAGVVCLDYADSRAQYTQAMAMATQFWPMAGLLTASSGIKLPATLPSLDAIIKDMKPMLRARWMAADGIYERYQGPGVEVGLSAVAGTAVGAAVMMPALAKSREQARSVASMSNLKRIGQAAHSYAEEHQGQWPADLDQMKSYLGGFGANVLQSPRKPKDFSGPSYIYVAGLPKTADAHTVMAYENPEYCTDRVNVLFADGHVEALKPDAFRSALKATYDKMGKAMPEIKFKGNGNSGSKPPSDSRPIQRGKASKAPQS